MKSINRLSTKFLPVIVSYFIKSLMGSVKVKKVIGLERAQEAIRIAKGKAIYATWHQRMSYHFYHLANKGIYVLISPSRDGELAARIAKRLGFNVVRGSSTRDSIKGLMGMVRVLRGGSPAGMLVDGPLGPPRVAKVGTVAMASLSGAPILPVVWGVDRCWILNSWDRYMIPKPFAQVFLYYAEPLWVPKGLQRDEIEVYRLRLQEMLNTATEICDRHFGQKRPWSK